MFAFYHLSPPTPPASKVRQTSLLVDNRLGFLHKTAAGRATALFAHITCLIGLCLLF